jgi:glycosyltransferase involved in cell wall biosynthesis
VIALNARIADFVRKLSPETRVIDIPNGVDTSVYRPPSAHERDGLRSSLGWDQRPRILFVGRLVPRKGATLAIEAARQLGADAQLVMAGPGRPEGLPENASALGELEPLRVAELYRAADCFLLPSVAEGFPVSAQQALASGMPVVLADDPVYDPYLQGAPEGVLRVSRTVEALVEALRRINCGAGVTASQRADLVDFAGSRYSMARCVDRHESLYAELIDAARAG